MAAGKADLSIYQGDDFAAIVTVNTEDGTPANIAGYTAIAQIRRGVADSDPSVDATFAVSIASPYINLSLSHVLTTALEGKYVWDLQLTSPSGAVMTILAGKITVTQEVSR